MFNRYEAMSYVLERTLEAIGEAVKLKAEGTNFDEEWVRVVVCLRLITALSEVTEGVYEYEAYRRGMECSDNLRRIAQWSLNTLNLDVITAMRKDYHTTDTAIWIIKGV